MPRGDVLDDVPVEHLVRVGGDVADVGKEQGVGQPSERVVGRPRRCARGGASTSAVSSTISPRDVFTRYAERFMSARSSAPTRPRLLGVSGVGTVITSESRNSSALPTARTPCGSARSGVRFGDQRSRTCRGPVPRRPSPTMPGVLPDSPGPMVCCHPPERPAASSRAKSRVSAMIIPIVSSGHGVPSASGAAHRDVLRVGGVDVEQRVGHPSQAAACSAGAGPRDEIWRPGTADFGESARKIRIYGCGRLHQVTVRVARKIVRAASMTT